MANYPPGSPFGAEPQQPFTSSGPRSRVPMVLGVLGAIVTLTGLFCCGGLALLMKFGLDVISVEVQDQLAARPEIRENIGEIESFEVDLIRSGLHEDSDTFVYDIEGTNGRGIVVVEQITLDDGSEALVAAELRMSDGRKIRIDISSEYESTLDFSDE